MKDTKTFTNYFVTPNGTKFSVEASPVTLSMVRNLLLNGVWKPERTQRR